MELFTSYVKRRCRSIEPADIPSRSRRDGRTFNMHPLDMVAAVRTFQLSVTSESEVEYGRTGLLGNRLGVKNNEKPISTRQHGTRQMDYTKRGRPRADVVSALILEGSATEGKIRCKICTRLFPREKSLQAHMRTHTGKKSYM